MSKSRNRVDTVAINFDRLKGLIRDYADQVEDKKLWWTPFGIALSLLFTLVVSEFKPSFAGLSGEQWRVLALVGLIGAIGATGWVFRRAVRQPTLESVMDDICAASTSRPRHYGLAFLKARDENGVPHMLVYFDATWDCYMCPYVRLHEDQSSAEDVAEPACALLGLPKTALTGTELVAHIIESEKKSQATQKVTNYRFALYLMTVKPRHVAKFRKKQFDIQGQHYKWLTAQEALADPKSAELNGEVFRHFRDYHRPLFGDLPDSFQAPLQ